MKKQSNAATKDLIKDLFKDNDTDFFDNPVQVFESKNRKELANEWIRQNEIFSYRDFVVNKFSLQTKN